MQPKRKGIKYIARMAGVSVSTVSKALRGSPEISEATKEKIRRLAQQTGYKPDRKAINLLRNKTMTLGIIVPEIAHYFFARVISGVETYASAHGYQLVVAISDDSLEKEKKIVEQLAAGVVDGIIVSAGKESLEKDDFSHFQMLDARGFPYVFFDRAPEKIRADKVVIDDVQGGFRATRHLIEKGCENIGLITTPAHIRVSKKREEGYRKALKEANLPVEEDNILIIDEKKPVERQINAYILSRNNMDGIFAVNEFYASLALRAALKAGINVPGELKIIGFTDGVISKSTIPRLSTIAQHGFLMGQESARLLIENINGERENNATVVIDTDLIKRETT